ncbi:MAG: hypothetical protein QOJ57_2527 [Thermoleophilaceae bacterium]|nr:hypothetical protein [Thermoleophilaceae bacterium]
MRRLAFALGLLTTVMLAAPASPAHADCNDLRQSPTKVTHRAPPQDLLSRMAVLRRPQQPDDLPGTNFGGGLFHLLAVDYIRKVGEGPDGQSYYLIPGSAAYPRLSRACLRRLSPHRRRVEQRIEREQRRRERIIGLGLFDFGRRGGGGGCCADAHALLANHTVQTSGDDHHSTVAAFVPDGVASVTLRWHRGPERNATVSNNFWRTTVPLSAPRAFPHSTIWRDADGHLVKSFRERGGR